jgi:hypothetical protein
VVKLHQGPVAFVQAGPYLMDNKSCESGMTPQSLLLVNLNEMSFFRSEGICSTYVCYRLLLRCRSRHHENVGVALAVIA